jgi:hypothetical protein
LRADSSSDLRRQQSNHLVGCVSPSSSLTEMKCFLKMSAGKGETSMKHFSLAQSVLEEVEISRNQKNADRNETHST